LGGDVSQFVSPRVANHLMRRFGREETPSAKTPKKAV